jgi:hypothetical protein
VSSSPHPVPPGARALPGARRLADRLLVEGIPACAEASRVLVGPEHFERSVVLAGLFREIDEGRSRVAPLPAPLWEASWRHQLLAVVVLGLIVVPTVVLALLAVAG